MKKWFIIGVMIAAMAMMVMPGSAYFQIWYADNPQDMLDGRSDVQWINAIPSPGDGGAYSGFQYVITRYGAIFSASPNYQTSWIYWDSVPETLPNGARRNNDPLFGWPNQGYTVGVADWSGYVANGRGYYADESWTGIGPGEESEIFQNYEGMTTYIQWIPEYDPFGYGEYYEWDPVALAYDPGPIFESPKPVLCPFAS